MPAVVFVGSVTPSAASPGDTIAMCGNVSGASAVTVGGVSATFTVTGSCISIVIPLTATTGPIVVTVPSGTITYPYLVMPVSAIQISQFVT